MKTDRELLELAARAAGLDVVMTQPFIGLQIRSGNLWNPLTDDGDAMRLAVELDISVRQSIATFMGLEFFGEPGDDIHAATRRAIVRAAAAIGEGME